jgi:hypothetical protein
MAIGAGPTLEMVPVIIEVLGNEIICAPERVVVYADQQVHWIHHGGGHTITFDAQTPFGGRKVFRGDTLDATEVRSGGHTCKEPEIFKYNIEVRGLRLDPVVEADPRKAPRK